MGGELPAMPRLDDAAGTGPPGPGTGFRPAGAERSVCGGGGQRPGRGDATAMNDTLINKIVTLFQGGASVRRIARGLGVSRRTVEKALKQVEQARDDGVALRPKGTRGSLLDDYEPAIVDLLARYPDITVQRIREELRSRGYPG